MSKLFPLIVDYCSIFDVRNFQNLILNLLGFFFRETPLINSSSYCSYSWFLLLCRYTSNFWKTRIRSSLKDPRQKYRQQKISCRLRSRIWWVHLICLQAQSDCPFGWFSYDWLSHLHASFSCVASIFTNLS